MSDNTSPLRFGIIGTGRMALRFISESRFVKDVSIEAIYDPQRGGARKFIKNTWAGQQEHPHSCRKLKSFLNYVDAVYIASPTETHFDYIMEALLRGKHVLCEKPMCLSLEESRAAFSMAASKGLVLAEAIETAYAPGFKNLLEAIGEGVIGRVRYLDSSYTMLAEPGSRELTDNKYGGSFVELGCYVVLPMLMLFGSNYTALGFESMNNLDGVDVFTKADFRYDNALATLTCGLGVKSEERLLISGEKGYITVEAPWWKTTHFEVHIEDTKEVLSYDNAFEGDGIRYELSHFVDRIHGIEEENNLAACSIVTAGIMEKFLSMN